MLDFLSLGSSLFLHSFLCLDLSVFVYGMNRTGLILLSLDHLSMESSTFLKGYSWFESPTLASGMS